MLLAQSPRNWTAHLELYHNPPRGKPNQRLAVPNTSKVSLSERAVAWMNGCETLLLEGCGAPWLSFSSSTTWWEQIRVQTCAAQGEKVLLHLAGSRGFWPPIRQVLETRRIPPRLGEWLSLGAGRELEEPAPSLRPRYTPSSKTQLPPPASRDGTTVMAPTPSSVVVQSSP